MVFMVIIAMVSFFFKLLIIFLKSKKLTKACGITNQQQNLIVGGITATAHSWPSIVYIRFDYALDIPTRYGTIKYPISSACGGSLIDRSIVLTAGKLKLHFYNKNQFYIFFHLRALYSNTISTS